MADQTSLDMALMSLHDYNNGVNQHLIGLSGTSIGQASYFNLFETPAIGFSATAFDYNGQIVLSFRGTNPDELLIDPDVLP
jgi:hypothetical protein